MKKYNRKKETQGNFKFRKIRIQEKSFRKTKSYHLKECVNESFTIKNNFKYCIYNEEKFNLNFQYTY